MERKGLLIILSGPSGVGKGTVRAELMKRPGLNLFYSISMTTRPMRQGEVSGREYYFVTRDQFEDNIEKGNLLEYAEFVGNYYGTPKDKVAKMLEEGKNVLLEIEVSGTLKVLKQCPDAVSIFLMPPSIQELEERIRGRKTESEEAIAERLAKARSELTMSHFYKHVVLNDSVTRAADEIEQIIRNAQ